MYNKKINNIVYRANGCGNTAYRGGRFESSFFRGWIEEDNQPVVKVEVSFLERENEAVTEKTLVLNKTLLEKLGYKITIV